MHKEQSHAMKMNLEALKVQSFVTLSKDASLRVRGGLPTDTDPLTRRPHDCVTG